MFDVQECTEWKTFKNLTLVHDFSGNIHIQILNGTNMCKVLNTDTSRADTVKHIAKEKKNKTAEHGKKNKGMISTTIYVTIT